MSNYTCGLRHEDFRKTVGGKETDLYVLCNAKGHEVAMTNYGGAICAIMVPDKDGNIANVIQGHSNIDDVINSPEQYLSTLIGRYCNRINRGRFTLGGKEYSLETNDGPNSLHGGPTGFHRQVWDAKQDDAQTLTLSVTLPYGHEGFSGEVKTKVRFTWSDDDELRLNYTATSNKQTVIALTHHAFFSLQGLGNPTSYVGNQLLQVNSDFYLPIDETSIPTGEILRVENTPLDFRSPVAIGERINADDEQIRNGSGIDHCFVCRKKEVGELTLAATLTDPVSGRKLETWTTEPGLQVYTGNFQTEYPLQRGFSAQRRSAVCLEAQHFPDSPNRPYFPSTVLNPGEKYKQTTIYKFMA